VEFNKDIYVIIQPQRHQGTKIIFIYSATDAAHVDNAL